jgi:ABC-2 type transport system ATP-binding protein
MKEKIVLQVEGITKIYGHDHVVDNVSFTINSGECVALIGPNGSGKTTLIKMITSLVKPDSGQILINNKLQKIEKPFSKAIGYTPDEPPAYDYLTGQEYLEFSASLHNISKPVFTRKLKDLLKIFPINYLLSEAVSTYSRGNKQKLVFIASLLSDPDLVIVDEPIVGLDPKSILAFASHLKKLKSEGKAILIASHILDFAGDIADRALLLNNGHLVKEITRVTKESLTKAYFEYD